ncbi:MAG: septation ring formation regulator EzrA [Bacilli bacterium]|nr:septation ring formation regulator EzrA [Bacilli bacterium]MDD4406792.1 septation ring formation regulator EzrA [Bacilli bacterium]
MTGSIYEILGYAYAFLVAILILITLIILKKRTKKKYNEILMQLEKEKNLILSGAILNELNKVGALINNKELEKKYKLWQNRYEIIKEQDMPNLNDRLLELEDLCIKGKFKIVNKAIAELEIEIYYVKTKSDFLLSEIKEISLSESKNREIVTKLKADYREIYLKYNKNSEEYDFVKVPLELQFENIDKLFASFEVAMESNAYSEVGKIVKALDDTIGNLIVVIEEAPTIIIMGKKLIPIKIYDIRNIYNKMLKENYNLDYLNIDYNITESEKKIADIFDRLNVLNLTDSIFELKTILSYFESLYYDFDNEKMSKKAFEENMRKVAIKTKKMLNIISKLSSKIEDIKYSYDLTHEEVKIIDELNINIKAIQNDYEVTLENYRNKSFAFSRLNKELDHLNLKLSKNEDKLELTLKNLSGLKEDELRAHEQFDEIESILKKSKEQISSYKLPIIPENYYTHLNEANEAINEMLFELNKKPISIRILNTRVDTARDLTLKLYKTTNETIKTAKLAENTIIYGNRFKPLNTVLNQGLKKAEKKFFAGNYKESLEQAINSISLVDADIHKKLIEVYQK